MQASPVVTLGIAGLALAVASLHVAGQAIAARHLGHPSTPHALRWIVITAAYLAVTAALALSGLLARFDLRPPPMALMFVVVISLGIALGISRAGDRLARGLPLWWLVAAQGFRFPLELVMHQAACEGVMPHEMSFSGYNFDIVTGITALMLAPLAARGRLPRWALPAWNAYGLLMLAVIAVVAFAGSPMVRAFGDDPRHVNTWVTHFPFVWLPAVLVSAALAGHVIIWRRLARDAAARRP